MRHLRISFLTLFVVASEALLAAQTPAKPPAHKPSGWTAKLAADGRHIELAYREQILVSGLRVELTSEGKKLSSGAAGAKLELAAGAKSGETVVKVQGPASYEIVLVASNSSVEVALRGFAPKPGVRAVVEAELHAGTEPLQARLGDTGDDVQQMASGRAASGLNDSVYDRFRDEALKVLAREARFTPSRSGFRVAAGGPLEKTPVCGFKLIEGIYSKRLPFYTPLDKKKWPKVPVGWCSWYYYFAHVKEEYILRNSEAIARDYIPFGLDYCLIDAGWQVGGDGEQGGPIGGNWTEANEKFPHGMKWIADKIRAEGLKPALWLAVFGNGHEKFYKAHPSWFLHDENGNAKLGTWFGTYVADFSNPELAKYLVDAYRHHTLEWGYDYFKLDGENDTRDLFARHRSRAYDPTIDADTVFRETLGRLRQAMSSKPNVFFSACGPVYPTESMGIAQAARLGGDVVGDKEPPSFRGVRTALDAMRRGYWTHNIAWFGDPDVLAVRPPLNDDEARTWTSILGLSGQLLMLSDDMAALPNDRREMIRKIIPVADITPMELYPAATDRPIWMLHVARPFASWTVAGLFNWDSDGREIPAGENSEAFNILARNDRLLGIQREYGDQHETVSIVEKALEENRRLDALPNKPAGLQLLPVPAYLVPPPPRRLVVNFAKVGLDPAREYLVFDFWKQKFLGKVRGEYSLELPPHASAVLALRPAEDHPQLVGTDRHITMGAVELKDEKWDPAKKELRIKVTLVENYPTTLSVYTAGSRFKQSKAVGAGVDASSEGEIVRAKLTSSKSGDAEITIQFE